MYLRCNSMQMTWKQDLLTIIKDHWGVGTEFTLHDLYMFEEELSATHPDNNTVRAKIRQTLQDLRRDLIVEFVDNRGTYRRRF